MTAFKKSEPSPYSYPTSYKNIIMKSAKDTTLSIGQRVLTKSQNDSIMCV